MTCTDKSNASHFLLLLWGWVMEVLMQLKYNRRGALETLQGPRSEENQKSPLLLP